MLPRLLCGEKIDKVDSDNKQANGGFHGDDISSDQFNTNRNSNVFCYQTSSYHDTNDKTKTS